MNQAVSQRVGNMLPAMAAFVSAMRNPILAEARTRPEACDFLAGNPQELALPEYVATLHRWIDPQDKDWFGYTMADRRRHGGVSARPLPPLGAGCALLDML